MVRGVAAVWLLASVACVGCSSKDAPSGAGLDPGKAGMGGAPSGGQPAIMFGAGAGGLSGTGGSSGTTSAGGAPGTAGKTGTGGAGATAGMASVSCSSPTVACNDGCIGPDTPDVGNCHLLVPHEALDPSVRDMDLDGGDLFISRGESIYKVGIPSGELEAVTTVADTLIFELKASGDSIYFLDEDGSDFTLMSVPRAGGTAKALGAIGSRDFEISRYLRVGGGFVVFEQGSAQLASVPTSGGDAVVINDDYLNDFAFDVLSDGSIFLSGIWGTTTSMFRGTLPFPFADPPTVVPGAAPHTFHAEDDYVYLVNMGYQRFPTAGGQTETLAAIAATNSSKYAITAHELAYTTDTGIELVSASGGGIVPMGDINTLSLTKILVDSDRVYALAPSGVVTFARP